MVQQRNNFTVPKNLIILNKEKTKLSRERIDRFKELVRGGEIPSVAKKIVLKQFKLNRAPNAGTPKWMIAGREELIAEGFDYRAGPRGPENVGGRKKAYRTRKNVTYDFDDRLKKDKTKVTKGTGLGKAYELAHTANIFQAKSLGLDYPIDSLAIQPQKINNKIAEALNEEMKPLYKRQLNLFKKMKVKNTPDLKKQMDLVNYNLSELVATGGKQGDDAANVLKAIHVNPDTVKPYVLDGGFNTSTEVTASPGATAKATAAGSLDDVMARENIKNLLQAVKNAPQACRKILNYSTGGISTTCAAAIETDPIKAATALEEIKPTSAALGKVRNAASAFLKFAGKGKVFGVTAAVGVGAGALVKEFRNDDPDTYLSNENQMKGMLVDTFEEDTLGKASIGGELAAAGLAAPGSGALYKARKGKGFGAARSALGPLGKVASGFATPLGMGLTLPFQIASQLREGDSLEDIATSPLNYLAPAFAGTLTKEATRGMNPTGLLAKGLRLGMSPAGVRGISKFFGLPGLALSLGYEGYDQYKKYQEEEGFLYNLLNKDD
jgi:hypothetical protein